MDHFYSPKNLFTGTMVRIEGEEFTHLSRVMRKTVGDTVRVVDGCGTACDVTLTSFRKDAAEGTLIATHEGYNEARTRLTLAVGLLKNHARFDLVVEKGTEIGVAEFVPLLTERVIPAHGKIERWQNLAVAAMKQSCRSYLPPVREETELEDLIGQFSSVGRVFLAHEQVGGESALRLFLTPETGSAIVLIGPEGGFSDHEVERCVAAGAIPVSLGARRLRTETAAITSAGIILHYAG